MKTNYFRFIAFIFILQFSHISCLTHKTYSKGNVKIRIASYNVEYGRRSTPEKIGKMFKPFNLDIIGFDEIPGGDWVKKIANILGMKYYYSGNISSANHKDKYKAIISKTPIKNTDEFELIGQKGWNPASVVKANTTINGVNFDFYSLHICASGKEDGHAFQLAKKVLSIDKNNLKIIVGDFNNNIGDEAITTIENAGFRPCWKDLDIDILNQKTYNAIDTTDFGVIDHIFYNNSDKIKTIDGGIIELETPLSDHKPIWAEIRIKR